MRKFFNRIMICGAVALVLVSMALLPSRAQLGMTGIGAGGFGAAAGGCSEATTFLARTSGLDGTHTTAYTNLICGLVTDSLWTSFDILYIFATQDATTALLNLPNATYTPSASGNATFTADRGYADDGSTIGYVDSGFNPTSGSPNYVQNSAHISVWNFTNTSAAIPSIGNSAASTLGQNIFVNIAGSVYFRINDNPEAGGLAVTGGDPRGHLLGNRSSSTARQGYQNGTDLGSLGSVNSQAPINGSLCILATICPSAGASSPFQIGVVSAGSSFNATQTANFYTRLRTYMTAVGAP